MPELDRRELRENDRSDRRPQHATGDPVGTGELAQALRVSPGTVTGMLKTLSEANLATYTPYEGARLTGAGRELALKVIRRHRLLELFLARTLEMSWDEVHEEAEHMEHAASERLIDRIEVVSRLSRRSTRTETRFPAPTGRSPSPRGYRSLNVRAGSRFRVVRVVDQDPAFLRYLSEMWTRPARRRTDPGEPPESGAVVCLLGRAASRWGMPPRPRCWCKSCRE